MESTVETAIKVCPWPFEAHDDACTDRDVDETPIFAAMADAVVNDDA